MCFQISWQLFVNIYSAHACQWCSGGNHQADIGSEDHKRHDKNHYKTVPVEVNIRNVLSSFPQSWRLKWRHPQTGSRSQVLLVFFYSVSGDLVWMMMLLLLGCVDRTPGNRPVCSLTDVSATAACMAFTTRTPWSEEPSDPSQRGSPGCLMALSAKAWVCWRSQEGACSLMLKLGKATELLLFNCFSQKSVGARIKYLGRETCRAETQAVVCLLGVS